MSEDTETTEEKKEATQAYYSPKYFKGSVVRQLIKDSGRRVSPEFLQRLDQHIETIVKKACETHNGPKKTLDASIADMIGLQ
jgi:hypothetical protein